MNEVYLALYRGNRDGKSLYDYWCRLSDWLIRKFTKGKYSHCEIAVKKEKDFTDRYDSTVYFECYSSSVRDKGVRCKIIDVSDKDKWDLILLDGITEQQIKHYFYRTVGKKYDWWGALGIVLGIKQKRTRYFCSEWCFNAIKHSEDGWRFSPNQLAVICRK